MNKREELGEIINNWQCDRDHSDCDLADAILKWHSQELDQRLAGVKELWKSNIGKNEFKINTSPEFYMWLAISNLAKEMGWK